MIDGRVLRHTRSSPTPKPRGFVPRLFRVAAWLILVILVTSIVIVLPWRWIAPPTTAFIVRERISSDDPVYYRWIPWSEISPQLAIAAVATEDQKFPFHNGFDLEAIADALESNRDGNGVRGASTISQQVAKNLFLWPGQNLVRKGAEAYLTVWIELLWPKRRILEVYLNVAEFGSGIFGAGAAADHIFGKPARALTLREAATLVAVLPSPKRMSALRPSDYVLGRVAQIERAVGALGGPSYLAGL